MKIIITGAQRETYWYATRIGEVFEVAEFDLADYKVLGNDSIFRDGLVDAEKRIPLGAILLVNKRDCEVVQDDSE